MSKLKTFSPKQKTVLTWWTGKSPYRGYEAISALQRPVPGTITVEGA